MGNNDETSSGRDKNTGFVVAILNYLPRLTKKQAFVLLILGMGLLGGYYVADRFAPPQKKAPGATTIDKSRHNSPDIDGSGNTVTYTTDARQSFSFSLVTQAVEQDDDGPPPPVPENFPDRGAQLSPLTDMDRRLPSYGQSELVVSNRANSSVILACSYEPRDKDANRASRYVHLQFDEVRPGEQRTFSVEKFGGPVHLSVYSKNVLVSPYRQWYSTDKWFDMGVVRSRTVTIDASNKGFDVSVGLQ